MKILLGQIKYVKVSAILILMVNIIIDLMSKKKQPKHQNITFMNVLMDVIVVLALFWMEQRNVYLSVLMKNLINRKKKKFVILLA